MRLITVTTYQQPGSHELIRSAEQSGADNLDSCLRRVHLFVTIFNQVYYSYTLSIEIQAILK